MAQGYNCGNCKTFVAFSAMLRKRWAKPQPDRCPRCGTVHAVLEGSVDKISPMPEPIVAGRMAARMPWMLPHTRPILPGTYECRFSETEPKLLPLRWDGTNFTFNGKRVQMRGFLSWRGEWTR